MARIRLTTPLSEISGKLSNEPDAPVLYTVDGRPFLRAPGKNANPNTLRQRLFRAGLTSVSKLYRTMTYAQAETWQTYIQAVQDKRTVSVKVPRRAYDVFKQINLHRFMAQEPPTLEAPDPDIHLATINNLTMSRLDASILRLSFSHPYGANQTRWRIRLTPPLNSPMRRAYTDEYRSPLPEPGSGYFLGSNFSETLDIHTDTSYEIGDALGVGILILSDQFVPGEESIHPRLELT